MRRVWDKGWTMQNTSTEKAKLISLDNIERISTLVWSANGRQYLWGKGETSDVVGPTSVSDVSDYGWGKWFIFVIADCYFPPLYAVRHESFESAYEEFCDWQVEQLKIEELDLKDYDENALHYSSNGAPIDTESVQGFEVTLVRVECAS